MLKYTNMNKGFSGILAIITIVAVIGAGLFIPKVVNLFKPSIPEVPIQEIPIQEVSLGADATLPVAGAVYTLSGSGVSGSATSIGLVSLTIPQTSYEILDADVSGTFYVTLEPGSRTRQELVSCTTVAQSSSDTTATLSGCTRGLLPISPYTASSTYQFAHGGGTSLVFSNPPQLYEEFAARGNAESITGIWTFSSTTIPRLDSYLAPTLDYQFAPKKYADDLAIAGVADGNYSTFGGFILATTSQVIAGTATSTATRYLVLPSQLSNTTSSAKNIIPVTKTSGKLSQGFLDLTEAFTFSGGVTSTGALVQSATSTFSVIPILPASNPTDDNQAARKAYVDTKGITATSTWSYQEGLTSHAVATSSMGVSVNTTAFFSATKIDAAIPIAKITIHVAAVTTAGTIDIAYYSHDGQNKLFDFTSPSISAVGLASATGTAVTVQPGIYYVALIPNGTTNIGVSAFEIYTGVDNVFNALSGEPRLNGTISGLTAGTLPTTFDPTTLVNDLDVLPHRLDN